MFAFVVVVLFFKQSTNKTTRTNTTNAFKTKECACMLVCYVFFVCVCLFCWLLPIHILYMCCVCLFVNCCVCVFVPCLKCCFCCVLVLLLLLFWVLLKKQNSKNTTHTQKQNMLSKQTKLRVLFCFCFCFVRVCLFHVGICPYMYI